LRTFPSKVTRGLHPTLFPTQGHGWITGLTKNGHVPKGTCGLMDTQQPAVLDDHSGAPVGVPVHKEVHPLVTSGGFRGSINLLASHTPIPCGCVGQGRDSKLSEGGAQPRGKKSSGRSFRFPPGPGWNDRGVRTCREGERSPPRGLEIKPTWQRVCVSLFSVIMPARPCVCQCVFLCFM